MNQKSKKYIALLLIVSFVSISTFAYFPQNSFAQVQPLPPLPMIPNLPKPDMTPLKEIPGKKDPVGSCSARAIVDFGVATIFKTLSGSADIEIFGTKVKPFPDITYDYTLNLWDCIGNLLEAVGKVALAKFKKQLLDRITDDTIAWISGNNPKYFTDFGKLFSDSADAALGDTLSDVVGSNICQPLRFNLNLGLTKQQTPFTQQTSCTLSRVVDNIENFQKNFSAGGWIGYNESLKPQNNPFGAQFLVQQELQKKEQANAEKQQSELTTSAGGTKPVKQCVVWEARLNNKNGTKVTEMTEIEGASFTNKYPDPDMPPPSQPLYLSLIKKYSAKSGDIVVWACQNGGEITFPTVLVSAAATKAITQDTDYLINTDDLVPYIAAIFDSAVNRLIKSGAKGLQGMLKSDSGTGRVPTPYNPGDTLGDAGTDYQNAKNALKNSLRDLIASSTEILSEASSILRDVTDLNTDISNSTSTTLGYKLFVCETTRFGQQQGVCSNTSSTIKSANLRIDQLAIEKNNLESVKTLIKQTKETLDSLSEDGVISLTRYINASIENLKSRTQTLNALKSELQRTKQYFESNLDQCKKTTETYVCGIND